MAIDTFNTNINSLFSPEDQLTEDLSDQITGVHFRG
jgi:hypothetical protein